MPVCGSLLAVEMLSRILGCRSAETARTATLTGAAIYIVVGSIPVVLGLAGPKLAPGLEEPEQLVSVLARENLSTFVYVMFAGALISAILSTVDSCLLAASSLVSHNLVVPLRPALTDRQKILTARIGVAAFGVLAYVIALYAGGIYELVATASAFGSAGIFVVGLFGLFSRLILRFLCRLCTLLRASPPRVVARIEFMPEPRLISARQQAGACGRTIRTRYVAACTAHARFGERIEVGCRNIRAAMHADIGIAHVVAHNEDDVGTAFLRCNQRRCHGADNEQLSQARGQCQSMRVAAPPCKSHVVSSNAIYPTRCLS